MLIDASLLYRITIYLILCFLPHISYAQSIAEKKASLMESGGDLNSETEKFLQQVNLELNESRLEESKLMGEVYRLYQEFAPEDAYQPLLAKIRQLREHIASLQESWREMIVTQGKQEGYALWYQPETTLEQLIIDYGSQDYVYIMKPEVAAIKISVDSNLPIPRASWNEMLELILSENGIGIRQLNPYLRELYMLRNDRSSIKLITDRRDDLELFSPETRVAFIITPEPSDVRRIWFFLNNFANPESSLVQLVGRDILIVARIADVNDLLRLYDFISQSRGDKEYKAVTLAKIRAEDMAKVLQTVFNQTQEQTRVVRSPEEAAQLQREFISGTDSNGLQVLLLGTQTQALFLVGTKEEIRKAEEVIREVESQLAGVRDKIIYYYTVKHSDPWEVAEVLSKVYQLMVMTGAGYENPNEISAPMAPGTSRVEQKTIVEAARSPMLDLPPPPYLPEAYFQPPMPVAPALVFPASSHVGRPPIDLGNFIVDAKTGSIVMVVETDLLPKIKELLYKIDVPKKMVQLEVLLFEKKIAKQNNFGLNILRLGCGAKNTNCTGLAFNEFDVNGVGTGIFDFFFSRERRSGVPAFDINYRFLLSQDDVTINASPSVMTVNQTPAFISIQEEISVNTGIVELETSGGVTLKDSFQRAQYGITLRIIPTIHMADEDQDGLDTISLDSDITFDTFDRIDLTINSRPNVTRRNVKNEARVADGETVIIGGLRRKVTEDSTTGIPFLGEIPGFGKLFSETNLRDDSTEMFIFITPKIVIDPACDLEWIRTEEMMRRPGDIPEFMCSLVDAENWEKNRLFNGWLTTLFGPERSCCYTPGWQNNNTCEDPHGEYDGR